MDSLSLFAPNKHCLICNPVKKRELASGRQAQELPDTCEGGCSLASFCPSKEK